MQVYVIQLNINENENLDERYRRVDTILANIREKMKKPDLIVLPELWGVGFFHFQDYSRYGEELKGRTFQLFSRWASEIGCYVHSGSFVEKENNNYYNTSLLLSPRGELLDYYRKIHLFGYQSKETEILTPGSRVVVVKNDNCIFGMATCYDLRFPELFRKQSEKEANVILLPAGWPEGRIEHWKVLSQARAIENQAFVISVNGVGSHGGATLGGNSLVVDPTGAILAQGGKNEEILEVEIDLKQLDIYRETFPVLKDRRIL